MRELATKEDNPEDGGFRFRKEQPVRCGRAVGEKIEIQSGIACEWSPQESGCWIVEGLRPAFAQPRFFLLQSLDLDHIH